MWCNDVILTLQLTELEAAWGALPGDKAVPLRFVRSEQAKKAKELAAAPVGVAQASVAGEPVAEAAVDAYEFLEACPVLSKVRTCLVVECQKREGKNLASF